MNVFGICTNFDFEFDFLITYSYISLKLFTSSEPILKMWVLWNNESGREIGRNMKNFIMGKRKSEYPREKIEDMIADEIVKRMKNGELITNPKDNRSFVNKN